MFDTQPYDAFELLGGYHLSEVESNTLQVARYHEEISKGKKIPIVGSTDSHGCEKGSLFGWHQSRWRNCLRLFKSSTEFVIEIQ